MSKVQREPTAADDPSIIPEPPKQQQQQQGRHINDVANEAIAQLTLAQANVSQLIAQLTNQLIAQAKEIEMLKGKK